MLNAYCNDKIFWNKHKRWTMPFSNHLKMENRLFYLRSSQTIQNLTNSIEFSWFNRAREWMKSEEQWKTIWDLSLRTFSMRIYLHYVTIERISNVLINISFFAIVIIIYILNAFHFLWTKCWAWISNGRHFRRITSHFNEQIYKQRALFGLINFMVLTLYHP